MAHLLKAAGRRKKKKDFFQKKRKEHYFGPTSPKRMLRENFFVENMFVF